MYPQIGLRFRGNNKGFREIIASGGVITQPTVAGGYKYHTFIGSGVFTLDVRGFIEYMVVAGGGGGGKGIGGGAGEVIEGEQFLEAGTYSVFVGNGGRGAQGRPHFSSASMAPSSPGGDSSFNGNVASGGAGGSQGGSSGSGFGRGYATGGGGGGGSAAAGSGYTGGAGTNLSDWASATGTGSSGHFAGGGGGSGQTAARGKAGGGGIGGGGSGGATIGENDNFAPSAGQARTGSGGGAGFAGYENYHQAGAGGSSGIVIVRYRIYKV